MQFSEFSKSLNTKLKKIDITLDEGQQKKLFSFMQLLKQWNEKMNLTAIIEENEIVLKHFVDSLTVFKYVKNQDKVLDIGTGAGFPGIPLKIAKKEIQITLVDSLRKRTTFLQEAVKELELKDVEIIHARAEELKKAEEYKEKYDIVVSRAVANFNLLSEYMLPFVKQGGIAVAMKGANIQEELESSENTIQKLGGKIEKIETFELPESNYKRNIIIISKK